MLIYNQTIFIDPACIKEKDCDIIRFGLITSTFGFVVPAHITSNKDKKDYKTGFLNELYSIIFPKYLKRDIFQEVTEKFNIFVDERQYQNMVREYSKKKYTNFIKK
jgi:hypothetical protein